MQMVRLHSLVLDEWALEGRAELSVGLDGDAPLQA